MSVSEINLKPQEKAEMTAYISLVEKCFLPAEVGLLALLLHATNSKMNSVSDYSITGTS